VPIIRSNYDSGNFVEYRILSNRSTGASIFQSLRQGVLQIEGVLLFFNLNFEKSANKSNKTLVNKSSTTKVIKQTENQHHFHIRYIHLPANRPFPRELRVRCSVHRHELAGEVHGHLELVHRV
jgi:hypothetical protein